MGKTFADKFAEALDRKREQDPDYGLRTLARQLADSDDPRRIDIIRRRLYKYRPPKGGGSAEVVPTAPTRWEIEDAMGLERDALSPDVDLDAAAAYQVLVPISLDYDLLAAAIEKRDRNNKVAA